MTGKAEALAALAQHHSRIKEARKQLADLEEQTPALVAECRDTNPPGTWDEIAKVLHTTQPYAVRKYRPLLEETRTVRVKPKTSEETP